MWLNLAASRMTDENPETAVKSRDSLAGRMTRPNSPKRNASPASGTPRTRVSRKLSH